MRNLSPEEVKKIENTLSPLGKKIKLKALAVYGSQVSGYAREESDYDILLVAEHYLQKIKYYYLRDATECSALVVDEKTFANDCLKSSLGEFVSGRLLNPFQPLFGKDYLFEKETVYKQKVVLEGLSEAYSDLGRFAEDVQFPLRYFLFEKLRKRAAIYPPVVYSYARTYGNELREANAEASLAGFRRAASNLERDGLVEFDSHSDLIRILPERIKGGFVVKFASTASYTSRGIKQYAVHGYAGRVGLEVVGREVASKLERAKEHFELPEPVVAPKSLWTIKHGKLFAGTSDWLSELLDYLGMDKVRTVITKKALGEIYNSTHFYTLTDGDEGRALSIAVKRYNDIKGIKWGLLNIWALKNTNFSTNSNERMHREYSAIERFRAMGLHTPEVLAIFLNDKILVTKFIKGKDLSYVQSQFLAGESEDLSAQKEYGTIIARVHGAGLCIGDTKPSNAIVLEEDKSTIYMTDLEQVHANGNYSWDLAEFIYYSARFTLKEDRARKLVNEFIAGYLEGGGDWKVIERTSALRYRAPFQAFIAPNVLSALRKDLASF